MNQEKKFTINSKSKDYTLAISEHIGSKEFKYMLRSELLGYKTATLFLLGIPNPAMLYASSINNPPNAITANLYQTAINSITKYISENDWIEGGTYYGEYLADNTFEISPHKPLWEDGNWGQKI